MGHPENPDLFLHRRSSLCAMRSMSYSGLRSIKCLVSTTVPSNSASVRGVLCGKKIFEYTQSSVRTFVSVMEDGTRSKRLLLATKSAIVQT